MKAYVHWAKFCNSHWVFPLNGSWLSNEVVKVYANQRSHARRPLPADRVNIFISLIIMCNKGREFVCSWKSANWLRAVCNSGRHERDQLTETHIHKFQLVQWALPGWMLCVHCQFYFYLLYFVIFIFDFSIVYGSSKNF